MLAGYSTSGSDMADLPPATQQRGRSPIIVAVVLAAAALVVWLATSTSRTPAPPREAVFEAIAKPAPDGAAEAMLKRDLQSRSMPPVPAPARWREHATRAFSDIEHQPQPIGTPLAARLEELRRSALAGDIAAAAQLHIELFLCSELPGRVERLGDFVDGESSSTWVGTERQTLAYQEAELADIDVHTRRCAGITEAQLAERHRWLEMAAAAGDANAALMYALDGPLQDSTDMLRDPQGLLAYKQKATRFLMDAAQRCNIEAMAFVASGYENGVWFPQDAELGAAFNLVAWRLSSGYVPNPQQGEGDMSQPAEQLAARIYGQYCL